jgi:hypothetical protein
MASLGYLTSMPSYMILWLDVVYHLGLTLIMLDPHVFLEKEVVVSECVSNRIEAHTVRGTWRNITENIAKRTSLTTYTYRRAEEGFPVKYSTVQEIKEAINSFLAGRNLPQTTFDQLGLNLE